MISFTAEQIAEFDKAQCKALLSKFDGMLDADTKAALTARVAELEKPADPTPFPKQDALTDAFEQWKYWGSKIKGLTAEARKGNHTYFVDPKDGVKGKRAPRAARTAKPKSKDGETKSSVTVTTEDGAAFTSFRLAAEHLGLTGDLDAEKINSVSWRRYIKTPVTVTFADESMFESFRDRMIEGANGKLPNWAGMENYTLIAPDGTEWTL